MNDEGVIKFEYYCEDNSKIIPNRLFEEINPVRNKLVEMGLIGQYADGLSYGNISIRDGNTSRFFITASDTGKIKTAGKKHYVNVISCNIEDNFCKYSGQGLPSSETLTHYIIYQLCSAAKSVIHIHDRKLWNDLHGKVPSTSGNAGYGTAEMVKEIMNLFDAGQVQKEKLIVMEGHEDGIVCFGGSVGGAMKIITKATMDIL